MLSCRQIGKLISEGIKEELEKGGSAGKPYPALIRQFGGWLDHALLWIRSRTVRGT